VLITIAHSYLAVFVIPDLGFCCFILNILDQRFSDELCHCLHYGGASPMFG